MPNRAAPRLARESNNGALIGLGCCGAFVRFKKWFLSRLRSENIEQSESQFTCMVMNVHYIANTSAQIRRYRWQASG